MKQVKVEMLDLYKNHEDVIEYFNYEFPKVLAKKMFNIGESSYTLTFKQLEEIIGLDTGSGFCIKDYCLITKALGYDVVVDYEMDYPYTLTFYL